MRLKIVAAFAMGVMLAPPLFGPAQAQPAADSYRTRLTSAAFAPNEGLYAGDGDVIATLEGRTLKVAGDFRDLGSPVTRVRLLSGVAVGAPTGVPVADLQAPSGGASGAISGELRLSPGQTALLRQRRLYVQVETEAAPEGALWGWLMPNHRFPGENVPEKANWYAQ